MRQATLQQGVLGLVWQAGLCGNAPVSGSAKHLMAILWDRQSHGGTSWPVRKLSTHSRGGQTGSPACRGKSLYRLAPLFNPTHAVVDLFRGLRDLQLPFLAALNPGRLVFFQPPCHINPTWQIILSKTCQMRCWGAFWHLLAGTAGECKQPSVQPGGGACWSSQGFGSSPLRI